MNACLRPFALPDGADSGLARPRQLVSAAALGRDGLPAGAILLEVACTGQAAYAQAHIPGARYLDTCELEAGPLFNKVPDEALLRVLLARGIGHASTVILYGRNTLAAARAAHLMLYAGVEDVRLLDGGFAAWRDAGLALACGPGLAVVPLDSFGAAFPGRPDYLADIDDARRLLARADGALVSIRTWNEFTGNTSGYSYIPARGEIPGARWGRAGQEGDVNSMSQFQHGDGRMLGAARIARQWRAGGIGPGQEVAFYCGTGWRASLAFYYAWLMGWERISVFDGGWFEWSSDPANPVVRRADAVTRPDQA